MQNPNEPKTGLPVEPKTALTIEYLRSYLHQEFGADFSFIILGAGQVIAFSGPSSKRIVALANALGAKGEVMATAKVNRMSGGEITS